MMLFKVIIALLRTNWPGPRNNNYFFRSSNFRAPSVSVPRLVTLAHATLKPYMPALMTLPVFQYSCVCTGFSICREKEPCCGGDWSLSYPYSFALFWGALL